jgi:hypothetical protein
LSVCKKLPNRLQAESPWRFQPRFMLRTVSEHVA